MFFAVALGASGTQAAARPYGQAALNEIKRVLGEMWDARNSRFHSYMLSFCVNS
jgi:hypothetical protein